MTFSAFNGLIGSTCAMQQLFDAVRRLAPYAQTVLVTGETGTGKELVARAFHDLGPRRSRRMATVNCSAVVETLFESELFGHVRGAFTGATETKTGVFEHADGGTLFLDEIGELPLGLQAKLLRAVEYGEVQRVGSLDSRKVDVAVIAATNRDLRAASAAGLFRSDLFYRLGVVEVHLPPLRERREDIPLLAAAFLDECAARLKRPITGIAPDARRLLCDAMWPGNVRELRNAIERACMMTDGPLLVERDFSSAIRRPAVLVSEKRVGADGERVERAGRAALLTTAMRDHVERVMKEAGGNKAAAAKLLGVSRRSLYRRLARISIGDVRPASAAYAVN